MVTKNSKRFVNSDNGYTVYLVEYNNGFLYCVKDGMRFIKDWKSLEVGLEVYLDKLNKEGYKEV